jgi:hypothetical protein
MGRGRDYERNRRRIKKALKTGSDWMEKVIIALILITCLFILIGTFAKVMVTLGF